MATVVSFSRGSGLGAGSGLPCGEDCAASLLLSIRAGSPLTLPSPPMGERDKSESLSLGEGEGRVRGALTAGLRRQGSPFAGDECREGRVGLGAPHHVRRVVPLVRPLRFQRASHVP